MIIELQDIHRKATSGVELHIKDEEMRDLLAIFRKHAGPTIVAAYRLCQKEKPGKPMRFFLDDFARYFARTQKEKPADECPECHVAGGNHGATCSRHPGGPPPSVAEPKNNNGRSKELAPGAAQPPAVPATDNFEDDIPWPTAEKPADEEEEMVF